MRRHLRTNQRPNTYEVRTCSSETLQPSSSKSWVCNASWTFTFSWYIKISPRLCTCMIFANLNLTALHSTFLVPQSQPPCLHSTQPFYHDYFLFLLYFDIHADLSLAVLLLLEEPLHFIHTALRRRGRPWRFPAVFIAAWVPAFVACQEDLDVAHEIFGGR